MTYVKQNLRLINHHPVFRGADMGTRDLDPYDVVNLPIELQNLKVD